MVRVAGPAVGVPFLWKKNSLRSDTFFWQKRHPHLRTDSGSAGIVGFFWVGQSRNLTSQFPVKLKIQVV
ncbi:hypothetical protein DIT71_11240 [Marinobacter vulgaris]|uniref:Uncharacterized protein n=1 Tax=Marinobacter vulgaris TaxID=1928331 RepID=A0A2V3ZN26_9GAMM|nr:hypothetical protein DIT71_11240 [Marinobacter vulgaris]